MDDGHPTAPVPIPQNNLRPTESAPPADAVPELDHGSLSSSPPDNPGLASPALSATRTSKLSRNSSFSVDSTHNDQDDWNDFFPPLDRLSVLDLLDNFALPQQLEKLQQSISAQTSKVRRQRDAFKSRTQVAKDRMVEEWRRRVPSADDQLERYRKRMRSRVDKLGKHWNNAKSITAREKISFICGVMNIFISGYLIGGYPQYFHHWYTAQLLYFMPLRFFLYHRRGYHYFLADLCYFTNFLLALSIWVFPASKRLFTASYCLAFGNNAVAIIMWRNSLVFHSFDKVTSLFIHIMPCATLHCLVHLLKPEQQIDRFPAIYIIKNSPKDSPTAYANVLSMILWSSLPYAAWQLNYYFFITVRRKEKIAAGRPTSFTWLRKSYSKTWIGKVMLSLPEPLQEPFYMLIQYTYACFTMLPCPLWFVSRNASGTFLTILFAWTIFNGSTYYIDIFGKRFQKELEQLKAEVAQWQATPDLRSMSPPFAPLATPKDGQPLATPGTDQEHKGQGHGHNASVDRIPLLDEIVNGATSTGTQIPGEKADARQRTTGPAL